MKNQKYEQPKLEYVSLEINDILMTSGEQTEGELDTQYTVSLNAASWSDVWGG